MLKFDVNAVLDGVCDSLVVRETVDLTDVRFQGLVPFIAPVSLTAQAAIKDGVVSLACTYDYELHLRCDRCLIPLVNEISQHCSHVVVRSLNGPDDGEFVVAPDGIVQLDELATNDIIPELPTKILCREDCAGLCPVCGVNRNQTACQCSAKEIDPRLSALNKFFES